MIRNLFRRRPTDLELADRLTSENYTCRCCKKAWKPAFACPNPKAPFTWLAPPDPAPDRAMITSGDVLTESFCRYQGDNSVRAYLPIFVSENRKSVFLPVWASLSEPNFDQFRAAQTSGSADKLGDMFSWLFSEIPGVAAPLGKGVLQPFASGRLPLFWLSDKAHPLFSAQDKGLPARQVQKLYESLGARVGPHLLGTGTKQSAPESET